MPTPRGYLATAAVNGKIYAIGGLNPSFERAQGISTVEEYDPVTDTWTLKADMPTPRAVLSTSVVNGKIYAIGGEAEHLTLESRAWVSTVEEYDPGPAATAVLETRQSTTPTDVALDQNYPNPFNSGTVIRFSLPQSQEVALTVYNLAGQQVATLVEGMRAAGTYAVRWNGRDYQERELASGLYLYRLQAGDRVETHKLLLLR